MKIILLGYSKISGGAGSASMRIADCLKKSKLKINEIFVDEYLQLKNNIYIKFRYLLIIVLSKIIKKIQINTNLVYHSLGLFGLFSSKNINKIDGNILNLLWINNETISIKEISKINKKIIWTIFDTWPFCGTEHYTNTTRFVDGYSDINKPNDQKGIDLDQLVWKKKKLLKNNIIFIATSNWLYKSLKKSDLFSKNKIYQINCPIDCNIWRPIKKNLAREKLGIEKNAKIIIYGGGLGRFRKGFDLLKASLSLNINIKGKLIVLLIGSENQDYRNSNGVYFKNIKFQNSIKDQILYHSAADIVSIPSRFDNMPYFGIESMACQSPLITFDIGGCAEMVQHMQSGWVSKPFDIDNYSKGVNWLLEDKDRLDQLSINAREYIKINFSYKNFIEKYQKVLTN